MAKYKVTLTIHIEVEINDENVDVDPREAFRGDTPKTALNRANWSILGHLDRETQKAFGIRRMLIRNKDMYVVEIPDQTQVTHPE